MDNLQKILTKEYLKKLETLSLSLQQKLGNIGYAGARKAKAQGSSLEFSDYRAYTLGDDLRRVDWNTYSRFEKLYSKVFLEEKQAVIHLFLDQSYSMAQKATYAKALAASLAYISLKNMDAVNLFAWGDGLYHKKWNIQSKNRFLEVVQFLESLEQTGETNFTKTLQDCQSTPFKQGVSIIFSDFFTETPWQDAIKQLQSRKQEIILVWVLSQEEVQPTEKGAFRLTDKETGEHRDLELTPEILSAYETAFHAYETELRSFCKKRGFHFVKAIETTPLLQTIQQIVF